MMNRSTEGTPLAGYKHWFIECKSCGSRITIEVYTGNPAVVDRQNEKLACPVCLKESAYYGEDFKTAELSFKPG
jgi:hypothetical protein